MKTIEIKRFTDLDVLNSITVKQQSDTARLILSNDPRIWRPLT